MHFRNRKNSLIAQEELLTVVHAKNNRGDRF